jgi:hypothetical protein
MPNHTSNFVEVETNTGCSKEQLALHSLRTMLSIHSGTFDFEGMIPMPKDLAKSFDVADPFDHDDEWENDMGHLVPSDELTRKRWIKEYGFDNWYDWRLANWDTKWNAYDVDIDIDDMNQLHVNFLTAWSCPTKIYLKLKEYCNEHNLSLDWGVEFEGEDEYFDLKEQDLFDGRWQ